MEGARKGPVIMEQCDQTKFGRINKNGAISTIYSLRNRPNTKGIVHKYGKKAGQLKKNKLINE